MASKQVEILDEGTQIFLHVTTAADSWLCCQILKGATPDRAKGIAFVLPRQRTRHYVMPQDYEKLAYDFHDYNVHLDFATMAWGSTWAAVCAHLATYPSLAEIPDCIDIQVMRESLIHVRSESRLVLH